MLLTESSTLVYLSAIPIMNRVFGTRRLALLSGKHNMNMSMTNFWPYLKQLRHELVERQMFYARSFLSRFFGEHIPIADRIWGCPDNDKQLTVALRYDTLSPQLVHCNSYHR